MANWRGTEEHRSSTCRELKVRGLRYTLRQWGQDSGRPLLFLHGARDSSISFQFVADLMGEGWRIMAPDWRGHGDSDWQDNGYWFHDFVADLDELMDQIFSGEKVPIVGHSLGGNVAGIYAGLRLDRLSHLISLDGFGPLLNRGRIEVPTLLTDFLDWPHQSRDHPGYGRLNEVALRLQRDNPRLPVERAEFLAAHGSRRSEGGRYRWRFDQRFRASLPSLHVLDDWRAVWSNIRVPVLWLGASDPRPLDPASDPSVFEARKAMMPGLTFRVVSGSGHNLHHDAPEQVAAALKAFVDGEPT